MNASDPELIARVLEHDDRGAFGVLVQNHQAAVRRYLRHLAGGDIALADDLAQETFVQAYRSLDRFRGDGRFSTWLFGIAHNHYRNARRKSRESPLPAHYPETADDSRSATRAVELRHDLAAALRQLDPAEQTALHLFYDQGLTHPEIAGVVGWPLGTVKTHLARAKDKLRPLLAAWNPFI